MKYFALLLIVVFVAGCGTREQNPHADHGKKEMDPHGGHGKSGQPTLMVESDSTTIEAGKPVSLKLAIHDAKKDTVRDFDILHEQKVHLIIVRAGLDNFVHLHPEVDGTGRINAKYSFPTGGSYLLFADYQAKGQLQATARTELKVSGTDPSAPSLKPNVPGKVHEDGLIAEISIQKEKKGGESSIRFDLSDETGKPIVDLQPYMGERGHLVILSENGKEYVHAHPVKGKTDQAVVFMAHFPGPGLYKGWGQFRRHDQVRVVPFVLKVD